MEFTAIKVVDELPTKGDNYHLYLLLDDTTEVYQAWYFKLGEWVNLPLVPAAE